jgi:20S proteasome alpha/beta subunit
VRRVDCGPPATSSSSTRRQQGMVAPDGSLAVNLPRDLCGIVTAASSNHEPLGQLLQESIDERPGIQLPLIWVGSCGCQVDCKELKRVVQRDWRAASFFGATRVTATTATTARHHPSHSSAAESNLAESPLFPPLYSSSVLAGLHHDCGHVYGYDAVGSYEEHLAVTTCAGQGRDLCTSNPLYI